MTSTTALVLRATGSQGKAVTSHLLQSGWAVHALVSDLNDPRAIALQSLGATLFKGVLNDASSIENAIAGCSALFLNQMPSFTNDSEVKDAETIIGLAKIGGVKHVVHSTTLALSDPNARNDLKGNMVAPGIIGKADVEDLVRSSGITWTILHPGWFMTNITHPISSFMFPELAEGKFVSSFKPHWMLPLVDPGDIGAFTAQAFQNPEKFKGRIVPVVSETMSVADMAQEMERVAGKKLEVKYRSDEESKEQLKKGNMLVESQILTETLGKGMNMEEVRAWGVPLTDFRSFLEKSNKSFMKSLTDTEVTRLNMLK